MKRENILFVAAIITLLIALWVYVLLLNKPSYPYRKYGVYYDFTEPNILRHYQGDEVTIYKKVKTELVEKEE